LDALPQPAPVHEVGLLGVYALAVARFESTASESAEARGERRLFALTLGAALFVLLLVGHPLFIGRIYVDTDLGKFHLPLRSFYSSCLASGDSFLWFPNFFSGFHLHGEGQAGMFHPLNLLLYATIPLTQAFTLELLRGYGFLLLGTFLLLRRWSLPRDSAMFGALLFSFSSFNLLHYVHLNVVGAAAHIPWLLLAIDIALRGRNRRQRALGALAVVGLTASQLLLGHPQIVWNSVLVELLYAGFVTLRLRTLGPLLALGAAKLLGALAAAVQIIPLLESLERSFRAAPPTDFVNTLALHPANLLTLLGPTLFETGVFGTNPQGQALYVGVVVPVLCVWLGMRWRALKVWRPLAGAALALAALSLLLSLGDWGLVYRLQSFLPVVGLFRAPARYTLSFDLGVAIAAAIAFSDLRRVAEQGPRPGASRLWPLALLCGTAIATAGWALVYSAQGANTELAEALAKPAWLAVGPVLVIAACAVVIATARGMRCAVFVLVLFAAVDQAVYGLPHVWRHAPRTIDDFVAGLDGPSADFPHRAYWGHPALAVRGVRMVYGYAAMAPGRELQLGGFSRDDPRAVNAARVAGIGWAPGVAIPEPLPRARLVSRAIVSVDVNRDIANIDVTRVALVDEPIELSDGWLGKVTILSDRPGRIELAAQAPTRQLLVLSESHHPGWHAEVDGAACPVIRVYADFMGCVVEAGRHSVTFRFEPDSVRIGARVSGLAVALALLGFGPAALLRESREPTSAESAT
jgi:hypothetical protein